MGWLSRALLEFRLWCSENARTPHDGALRLAPAPRSVLTLRRRTEHPGSLSSHRGRAESSHGGARAESGLGIPSGHRVRIQGEGHTPEGSQVLGGRRSRPSTCARGASQVPYGKIPLPSAGGGARLQWAANGIPIRKCTSRSRSPRLCLVRCRRGPVSSRPAFRSAGSLTCTVHPPLPAGGGSNGSFHYSPAPARARYASWEHTHGPVSEQLLPPSQADNASPYCLSTTHLSGLRFSACPSRNSIVAH